MYFPALLRSWLAAISIGGAVANAADTPRPWPEVPFRPVNAATLETLPAPERAPWLAYLAESTRLAGADRAALEAERARRGHADLTPPPKRKDAGPRLREPAAWYRTAEAEAIAGAIVSFQTPAGGWSKAVDYRRPRAPGEHFAVEPTYLGTFDNDATFTELRFLALMIASQHLAGDTTLSRATPAGASLAGAAPAGASLPRPAITDGPGGGRRTDTVAAVATDPATDRARVHAYRTAFERGLRYVFAAQYPNGGFPQVYPLVGGYHDAVTYNDGAMIAVLTLLRDIADARPAFEWIPVELRDESRARMERGVACLLASQTQVAGRRTVWGQQHDPFTLAACAARNFEPVAHCTAESAGIASFLMALPNPSAEASATIEAAVGWLKTTALPDVTWQTVSGRRALVPTLGAAPLWSRFYEIGTDRPIFGDRDRSVHYSVEKVSTERVNGYAWFVTTPAKVIAQHAKWRTTRAAITAGTP